MKVEIEAFTECNTAKPVVGHYCRHAEILNSSIYAKLPVTWSKSPKIIRAKAHWQLNKLMCAIKFSNAHFNVDLIAECVYPELLLLKQGFIDKKIRVVCASNTAGIWESWITINSSAINGSPSAKLASVAVDSCDICISQIIGSEHGSSAATRLPTVKVVMLK